MRRLKKDQLERIRAKIEEIQAIVNEDPDGSSWIIQPLKALRQDVQRELRNAVFDEYERTHQPSS